MDANFFLRYDSLFILPKNTRKKILMPLTLVVAKTKAADYVDDGNK
jgi:hypothetical protein